MAGSKQTGFKAKAKMLARDPEHYKRIGKIGGSRKVKKGFAITGNASAAGKIGGRISKRHKKAESEEE